MYKVGDKVRIKTIDQLYKEDMNFRDIQPYFINEMDIYAGRPAKIVRFNSGDNVILDIDGGEFAWHIDWLHFRQNIFSIDDNLFEL